MLNTKMINLGFTDVKNCEKQEVNYEEDDDRNTKMGCAFSKIFYVLNPFPAMKARIWTGAQPIAPPLQIIRAPGTSYTGRIGC